VRPPGWNLAGGAAAAAAGAWIAYAWLPHLATPTSAWRGPGRARRIGLTFDDGPDPVWTPRVLEILAAHGVPATFFLVGARAARAPGVVRAVAAGGHEIGNHSWSHRSLWLCGPWRTEDEVARAHDLLADLSGRAPRCFRPPWGMVNAALPGALRRAGERCVFWSIQPEGLRPQSPRSQAASVLGRAHPGAIVNLHDAEGVAGAPARLIEALPAMIDGLRAAGYDLVTVTDLLDGGAEPGSAGTPLPH
jgi:peptidoglycan/xylan/chitin deacetylase (PgdA/CDA1 family)